VVEFRFAVFGVAVMTEAAIYGAGGFRSIWSCRNGINTVRA
jgi:hypothetical protein